MFRELKTRLDSGPLVVPNNHGEQRSVADDLKVLLDGIAGSGSVIDASWTLPHASTQDCLERQGRLTAAKRKVRTASRKSILAILLAHDQVESAKLGLANRDLRLLRFAYLELLDMEIAKYVVSTMHEPPAAGSLRLSTVLCPRGLTAREGTH